MQRDALISMLKKELYELQDKEHEFIVLNDEINTVEAKYNMIKDEKDRIENEHRYTPSHKGSRWISIERTSEN